MRTKNARKVRKCLSLDHWVILSNGKGFSNTCINTHTFMSFYGPQTQCFGFMKPSPRPKNLKLEILNDLSR